MATNHSRIPCGPAPSPCTKATEFCAVPSPVTLQDNGPAAGGVVLLQMDDTSANGTTVPELPPDLRQRIASLLPPNDLALGWRLTCKEAAQRCSEPHQRTARVAEPLPGHATTTPWCMEAAAAELRQLTFRRKLLIPSTAACSGCEANVEFAWQLLQPHVFPELLHTYHYRELLIRERDVSVELVQDGSRYGQFERYAVVDVGSAAVAAGLSHMLPSLEQRCPGLVDPGATMEAAARHCGLEGLQAVRAAVGVRLHSSLETRIRAEPDTPQYSALLLDKAGQVWRRTMAAAAGSPTPDAVAKMEWILEKSWYASVLGTGVRHEDVCGAASASGDLSRLRWLREHGFSWRTAEALAAVVRHADLPFIQQLEQEGGYLPPPGHEAWSSKAVVRAAAGAQKDAVAKLCWLADRGVQLKPEDALDMAAWAGNLEAAQLLLARWHPQEEDWALPEECALADAVASGSVPMASWLHHAVGYPLEEAFYRTAGCTGDVPMLRWLMDAGCPREELGLASVVSLWPSRTPADGQSLLEVVQLLVAADWPMHDEEGQHPLTAAVGGGQPWAVWKALWQLLPVHAQGLPLCAAKSAAAMGCEAMLEWLVGQAVYEEYGRDLQVAWYAGAAGRGDLGTLACLQRLGVPLCAGVVAAAVREGAPGPALRWLVEQGVPWSSSEIREALIGLEERLRYVIAYGSVHSQQAVGEVKTWLQGLLVGGAEAA